MNENKVNAAFIFVAPKTDSNLHRVVIETPALILNVIGVKNYDEGVVIAKEMADKGVGAIELCAGFGNQFSGFLVGNALDNRPRTVITALTAYSKLFY